MKQCADIRRTERVFEVVDWVYLQLQSYHQISVASRPNQKLATKFYGPFEVQQRVGIVAYRLRLPNGIDIHPVIHISQLKRKVGSNITPSQDLPPTDENGEIRLEPIAILNQRMEKRGNQAVTKVLIQWLGLNSLEAAQEDYTILQRRYPNIRP